MPINAEALKAAIIAQFKQADNSLGEQVVNNEVSTTTKEDGSLEVATTPQTGVVYVDEKLAKAIAGAVATALSQFIE